MDAPFTVRGDSVALHVRVTPNAGTDRIEAVEIRDDGKPVLRIRVRATPEKDKANKALITLLAKKLDLAKSAITLVSGHKARFKTLNLAGDSHITTKKLIGLIALLHP